MKNHETTQQEALQLAIELATKHNAAFAVNELKTSPKARKTRYGVRGMIGATFNPNWHQLEDGSYMRHLTLVGEV